MKAVFFARFARAYFIFWQFEDILVLQARNQGGCMGCVRTPPQAPKVRILIVNIQVKKCSRLNWSLKLNNDV